MTVKLIFSRFLKTDFARQPQKKTDRPKKAEKDPKKGKKSENNILQTKQAKTFPVVPTGLKYLMMCYVQSKQFLQLDMSKLL